MKISHVNPGIAMHCRSADFRKPHTYTGIGLLTFDLEQFSFQGLKTRRAKFNPGNVGSPYFRKPNMYTPGGFVWCDGPFYLVK